MRLAPSCLLCVVALAACALDRSGVHEQTSPTSSAGPGGTGGHGGQLFGEGGFSTLCEPGTEKECYSGPIGTSGIGSCKVGHQICSSSGHTYGGCLGDVVPSAEKCETPVDESCDGEPSCKGTPSFAVGWPGSGESNGVSIALDLHGNVIVGATFDGTLDFGTKILTSAGAHDILVAKFDPEGALVWADSFGDASDQTDVHVGVDAKGDILLAGRFSGKLTFGGRSLTEAGNGDVYVAKLDPKGNVLWSHGFGDSDEQFAEGIAVDTSGNAIVIGAFKGQLDFGATKITAAAGGHDVFAAKLDPDGAVVWAKRWGGSADQWGVDIAPGAGDELVITGWYIGAGLDLGGGGLLAMSGEDVFVAKLQAGGQHVWSKGFGSSGDQAPSAVRVGPGGAVVLAGNYAGSIDFGDGDHVAADGEPDMFVAKLKPDGTTQWSKVVSAPGTQTLLGAAVDGAGNVVACGRFHGTVDFGSGPFDSPGGDFDAFVMKVEPDGSVGWAQRFYETDTKDTDQVARAVGVDAGGRVFFTGSFVGTLGVGSDNLVGDSPLHMFLARLAP